MAVIKFPRQYENFQETEVESQEITEGTSFYSEETDFERESATAECFDNYSSSVNRRPPPQSQAPKISNRRKTPSPAQIIAQSITPPGLKQSTNKRPPTAVEILAQSVQPTHFALAQEMLVHAFWQGWIENEEYLRRKCLYLLGTREDAEDALSTAMIQAFHNFTSHAGGVANMRAWLTTIVHNACMDGYRKSKRQKNFFTETEASEYENMSDEYGTPARSPEDIVRIKQSLEQLYRSILALPAALREPLLLRTIEHLPYPEIARRLKLTEANVRKRVQQARDQLRNNKKLDDGLAELLGIAPENF